MARRKSRRKSRRSRRRGGVGNSNQIAAVRKGLKHVDRSKQHIGNRAPQLPRDDKGFEMSMHDWRVKYAYQQPSSYLAAAHKQSLSPAAQQKKRPKSAMKKGGRRRRRRRTRRQKGGNLWRNFFKEPAFPPGGPYQVGCANLKQGRYYDKLCNTCLPNPKSSVGDMYPGYKSRMKGGRRRKTRRRRRTRRTRRTRRSRRNKRRGRRRVQRGGKLGDPPKPLPTKQIMGWMQNKINNFLPSQLINAGRAAALGGANLQHKYYGERTQIGGDPMQQPIGNMKSKLNSLSELEAGPSAADDEVVEEVNEPGKLPGKPKVEKESDLALANSKINDQLR